ncbi:MAG: phytoene desaturase [Flavobacteriales bacterium]|nr:phytoene desaturase [Flavobacteriales bacterium]
MKAAVIGSGIAGIAAALRLRSKGYDVTVFEAADKPGGKLAELQLRNYRFDMGPSLFTLPNLVDELFDLFPQYKSDFSYQKLDVICNYFWKDGHKLRAHKNTDSFAKSIESEFGVSHKKVLDYLAKSKANYNATAPIFMEQSLHKISTWLSAKIWKPLLSISKLNLTTTLHEVNQKSFNEQHVVQLFNRYATYNGSSPFLTPGIMQVIPHLEYNLGAFFPKKGMRSIVSSLIDLAKAQGVEIRCNERVKKIIVCGGKARGVELEKEVFAADVVVSNSDVFYTHRDLLKGSKPKEVERSSSAVIFYWGVKKKFPELDVHNIFFSKNYEEEFIELFDEKKVPTDPTIYIHVSSKVNPEDSPNYGENWFVMVNTPADQNHDWPHEVAQLRAKVLSKLKNILKVDLEGFIEVEHVNTPKDIEQRTGSYKGALYGTSSNSQFAAFLRHPNFSTDIKNLYHCGGSAHPGGGIPLCLNSAKIVASLIPDVR